MPETARILSFPARTQQRELSRADARSAAERLLNSASAAWSEDAESERLVEVLLAACNILRERINSTPAEVGVAASALYARLQETQPRLGLFDERHFVMGELAWLAGNGCRLGGRQEDAERWLDRSDANFRHTVNPAPLLARVSFSRLSLRYDMHRYDEVLEFLPSVSLSFEKLGMQLDLAKTRFLEALALKESGRPDAAVEVLERLTGDGVLESEPGFLGMAFVNLGDLRAQDGDFDQALTSYGRAHALLKNANHAYAIAHLKVSVADTLQRQGKNGAAIEAFREAVASYEAIEMSTWVAFVRLHLAEALLQAGRAREAEWEILAALPTIEEQKMVPEGFAAVALLRESVKQRKTDPGALLELRQYLRAKS
jgi:tetratricopeptide (TPR) repeat protein